MPKRTPENVVAYIVDQLTSDPSTSYPQLVRRIKAGFDYVISIEGVKKLAVREITKIDPAWKKINPLHGEYTCQFRLPSGRRHMKKFKGERGYSGEQAIFCAAHRTGKHSGMAVEEKARKMKLTQSFLNATDDASPEDQKGIERQYFEELSS